MSRANQIAERLPLEAGDARDIAAVLSGDEESYGRLVERYQGDIARQMSRFSRDPLVRDELVHDVFVEAYLGLRTFRGTSPLIHWLRKIAVRVGYRYWTNRNSRKHEMTLSEEDWDRVRGTLAFRSGPSEAADLVFALLERLSSNDRLILTLIYLDGCTMAEAAERAGCTVVGAKVRALRARNRLKKLIEGERS